jgi:hypothetical protein
LRGAAPYGHGYWRRRTSGRRFRPRRGNGSHRDRCLRLQSLHKFKRDTTKWPSAEQT